MFSRASATLLSRTLTSTVARRSLISRPAPLSALMKRQFTTLDEAITADDAWRQSCYVEIDYTIPEEATVYEGVQRMSAFGVGCLITVDSDEHISGVVSERDYVNKIALLGKASKDTKIKEISTKSANLVTATRADSVEECMQKMLAKGVRHLPLLDDDGKAVGMVSIKDLVKAILEEKEKTIKVLSDFALGKGGHFGSE